VTYHWKLKTYRLTLSINFADELELPKVYTYPGLGRCCLNWSWAVYTQRINFCCLTHTIWLQPPNSSGLTPTMKTHSLNANNTADLKVAETILREGGTVAVPTETVYGLAADASNAVAVASIFEAKGRPTTHPLIVHIANTDELENWAIEVPEQAYKLAEAFWPGPLTLLLKKANHVSSLVTGGLNTIGIRVPSQPVLHRLLLSSGLGLAAPSANPYKELSPTSAEQVLEKLNGKIDAVLDGGESLIGVESTIVDLTQTPAAILRAGPIPPSEISAVLGYSVGLPMQHSIAVPGNVDDHYQPRTPLYVVNRQEMKERLGISNGLAAYVVGSDYQFNASDYPAAKIIVMPKAKKDFAKVLYKTLHNLDAEKLTAIWFECPPQTEEWLDVNDRLKRASYGV
jgi:L-threonylcarbamoyladenylate synthase